MEMDWIGLLGWPNNILSDGGTGAVNEQLRFTIFVSLAVGLVVVLIDALSKYPRDENLLPISGFTKIRPSMLATSIAFRQSYLIYVIIRLLIFLAVAIVLPVVVKNLPYDQIETWSGPGFILAEAVRDVVLLPYWPAVWGLAAAGVLDNIPFLKRLEPAVRRLALTVAYVPNGVRIIKRQISTAPFQPPADLMASRSVNRFLRAVEPQDFQAPRGSVERHWARFAAILHMLSPSNRDGLRSRFIEEYHGLFANLDDDFRGLETRMRLHRREQSGGLHDPELREEVRDSLASLPADVDRALDKAEFLLACAIPTAQTEGRKSADKLRALGFAVERTELDTFGNLFVSALVVAIAAFFGAILSHVITAALSAAAPETLVFPRPAEAGEERNMFSAAMRLVMYSTVVLVTLFLATFTIGRRAARISAARPHPSAFAEKPLFDYALAAFVGAVVAVTVLVLMVIALAPGGDAEAAGPRDGPNLVALAVWGPRLLVLCFIAQVLVYGNHAPAATLARQALLLGLFDAVVTFMSAVAFFQLNQDPPAETLGSALYLAIVTLAITPGLLFIYAQLSHRQRALRLAAEPMGPTDGAPREARPALAVVG